MIHPNLATMLAVVTTDYPLEPGEAIEFLRPAVDASFNAISVDGECSTNDTVSCSRTARAASSARRRPTRRSRSCIRKVCGELARQIVADGEGATVLAEIAVRGAASEPEAKAIARAHRDLAAREDGAASATTRTGAACSRPRARRRSTAATRSSTPTRSRSRSTASRCSSTGAPPGDEPALDERPLHDRARPRARRRPRELPHERPLVRLRPHQRGLPDVSVVVLKVGGASTGGVAEAVAAARAPRARRSCVVHGAGPQISEEMERRGLAVEFVGGRRVTTAAGLEVVRESFAAVNAALCAAIGARAVGLFGDEIGLEAEPGPGARARRRAAALRAAARCSTALAAGHDPRRRAARARAAERQRRRGRGRARGRPRRRRASSSSPTSRACSTTAALVAVDRAQATRGALARRRHVRGRHRPEAARRGDRRAQRRSTPRSARRR